LREAAEGQGEGLLANECIPAIACARESGYENDVRLFLRLFSNRLPGRTNVRPGISFHSLKF